MALYLALGTLFVLGFLSGVATTLYMQGKGRI